MRVMLLGPFEVRGDDGRPIEVSGTRLRTLLARLALEPGRVVPVDVLIEAIWGDEPPASSANALQTLVSRARRLVGAAAIESHQAGYRLAIAPDDVDVARFERLITGDLAALREAESLWRGPALADLADLPFAANTAVRLAELRLSAAEDRLELELAEGADVLAELQPLATARPLRERLQGLLMRALYAAGRQADALDVYERTRHTLAEELGVDPSAELAELHLAILRHDPQHKPPRQTRRTNLRAQVTSFVGREQELAQLGKALQNGRLVTVVGPGGAGKTRLAAELAGRSDELAPGGVWLVELASVTEPLDVARAVLTAIGARDAGWFEPSSDANTAEDRLIEAFANQQVLLVLDNCEHVVSAAAQLADRLLGACPGLRILATSRESLAVAGETLYPIPPLEWPGDVADDPRTFSAVRLFAERAAAVRPDFALDETNAETIIEICRRLDGMPLAIELAAARMRALSVTQIAAKLDDRFRLLSLGSRTALPRHRTLQAVVDWSWDLLSEPERDLAMRLAVFPGGATLDALEAVGDLDAADVVDALTGLVDKSLAELSGERYRMQETVRSYGTTRLIEAGQDRIVRDRHARYFLRLAETADPELRAVGQLAWMARLRAEHDNILAAIRFAADATDAELGVRLVAAVWWFWYLQGRRVDGVRWSHGVLDLPGEVPAADRPARLVLQGVAHTELGAVEAGQREISDAVSWYDSMAAAGEEVSWQALLVVALAFLHDQEAAARAVDRMLPWLTGWERGVTLMMRSITAESEGDIATAFTLLDEARHGLAAVGDRWALAATLRMLAEHHARQGYLNASIADRLEALRLAGELGIPEDQADILARLAMTHARLGELDRARAYINAAWDFAERMPQGAEYIRLARAEVLLRSGAREAALRDLDAAEEEAAGRVESPQIRAWAGCYRAMAALLDGDPAAARPVLDTVTELAAAEGDMQVLANAVHLCAALVLADEDPERAAYLLGVATALRGTTDLSRFDDLLRPADRARALLGDDAFAAAYDSGAALARDAALEVVRPVSGTGPG